MYIKALEIKNFKKIENSKIEFPSDITVIKGKNESGKSTLKEALVAALFFDPSSPVIPAYIKDFKNWKTSKLYTLNLYFEAEGENYILEKDFENKKIILKKENGDPISHDYKEISGILQKFGGYKGKELFASLSSIEKENLALLDSGKKKIVESLQDMVSGSSSSVSVLTLLKKLKKTREDLLKGLDGRPVKNVGKIKLAQDREKEIVEKLEEMKKSFEGKESLLEELAKYKKNLQPIEKEKDLVLREYEGNKIYFAATGEIEKLNKEYDLVSKDVEAYQQLDKEKEDLDRELKELKPLGTDELESIENISVKIKVNEENMGDLNKKIFELAQKHESKYFPTQKITFIIAGILIVLGLLGIWNVWFFSSWFLLAGFVNIRKPLA